MDDQRFDSLVKAVARGSSRRSVLKGLLGLGGVAVAGGTLLESEGQAARRPTPTPKPPSCPGKQLPCATGCCCPPGLETCGSDCCTGESVPAPQPGHSECCDQACCFGTCYGEELCCPTNNRSTGEFPIPPTHKLCQSIDNGTQCCAFDQPCCSFDGCCDTICWGDGAFCCPNDPVSFCPGGSESADLCCVNEGSTLTGCCNAGTNDNKCIAISVEGACCSDAECGDPCQRCNLETNICEPRCDLTTQVCCTEQAGPGVCVTGACCPGGPGCDTGQNCCVEGEGESAFSYCTSAPCECDRLCSDTGLDCCTINNVFAGCYNASAEGACCTAGSCEYLNDFDNCKVGACIDFACEQRSSCTAGQYCCDGSCSDTPCNGVAVCIEPSDCDSLNCCGGHCCGEVQHCCDGGCSDEPCRAGEAGEACEVYWDCISLYCCQETCCAEGERYCCPAGCSDEPCPGGEEGDPCESHAQCLSAICCQNTCCAEGESCGTGGCGTTGGGGATGAPCQIGSDCLSANCCEDSCC